MRRGYLVIGLLLLALGVVVVGTHWFREVPLSESWEVTYYVMLDDDVWGEVIGTDEFPSDFDFNPVEPAVETVEPVGFKATTEINALEDVDVEFTVVADDGVIILFLDGESEIHLEAPDPDLQRNTVKFLRAGTYGLEVHYYQLSPVLEDDPHAGFEMNLAGVEQTRVMQAGGISKILVGGLVALLASRRKSGPLDRDVVERDAMWSVYFFVYLFISLYILLFILTP